MWDGYGRRAYWRTTPPGIDGQRRCGTDADFEFGGTYNPDANQTYGALGWPNCCYPPCAVYGGAGAGGTVSPVVRRAVALYGFAAAGGTIHPRVIGPINPMAAGLTLGANQLDVFTRTDPMAAGLTLGANQLDVFTRTDPMAAGLTLGANQLDVFLHTDPMAVGLTLGAEQTDDMVGSIYTQNLTGGPVPMSANVTFKGISGVQLSVDGAVISFAINGVTPAPPSSVTAAPGNSQVTIGYLIGAGGSTANIYRGTSSAFWCCHRDRESGCRPLRRYHRRQRH